jgi:hypothetical protein
MPEIWLFLPYEGVGIFFANIKPGELTYIHPAWYSFIKYCQTLRFGEIDKIKIQDGLPMIAEEVKKKIKFTG